MKGATDMTQKISPFLWFDKEAEEAAKFYVSVFGNSKINHVARYTDAGPGRDQDVMVVDFELDGCRLTALNGGPMFKFTEAISLYVDCEDQAEVDRYWNALTADGGKESMCGWLKDRYGLSWQIVPKALTRLINDPDRARASRVMEAMLQMRKIDVSKIEAAARG
jgi:predicted 3-demethylubiquinone-9 3-methyltransferase (glyoxalase superfamily)